LRTGSRLSRAGTRLRLLVADTDCVGEALCVQAANQLDSDINISVGSASHDWRRDILPRHDAERVAAPAQSHAHVGLFGESDFLGVNANEEIDRWVAGARTADSKRRAVRACATGCISARGC
jgi:hypothetical protein